MKNPGLITPTQRRSQQTLERILASSTSLIAEKSYEDLTIADIASRASISVGGFYSRFKNKEALFQSLHAALIDEIHERIEAGLARNWSIERLEDLIQFVVAANAEIYEKYKGVLRTTRLSAEVLGDEEQLNSIRAHNADIVRLLEQLFLMKRSEIRHQQPLAAVRTAIACMTSMLRDAIVFSDLSLYDKSDRSALVSSVTQVLFRYLTK